MAHIDLGLQGVRKKIIDEIMGEENEAQKNASLKAFEIYRQRQADFIVEKLKEEFGNDTVRDMRKVLSINLSRRIINELASVFSQDPERSFGDVSEREQEQLENLYFHADVNNKLKLANKYFKLNNQVAIQIIPKMGKIMLRPLLRHHYDVLPNPDNPELAFAYVLSVYDKFDFLSNTTATEEVTRKINEDVRPVANRKNEAIADPDDYRGKLSRLIWWTADAHFETTPDGVLIEDPLNPDFINPIGRLPFVDIAEEKDFEFFVREGHNITDFCVEFGAMLSDLANIARLQGYAQAVVSAEKQPEDMIVGPNRTLFLQLDPNRPEAKPTFSFATPSPDLAGGMAILEMKLKLFLNGLGLDPKLVSGDLRFNSGIERLLAMIDKAQASANDFELFSKAEEGPIFDLIVAWSNALQGVTEGGLIDDLNIATINENAQMSVKYHQPSMVRTETELEDSVIKKIQHGLMSRKEAIMELRDIEADMAEQVIAEIDQDQVAMLPSIPGGSVVNEEESS